MSTDNKRKKLPRHTSPAGVAVFPRLSTPDFKFKKEHGEYSIKLRLSKAEAEKIIAAAELVAEESYKEQVELKKDALDKKGKPIVVTKAEPSYAIELDDNKQPTGNYLIAFKMAGGYEDKKTGAKVKKTVPIVDAKGQKTAVDIWGGSKVKVAYELAPYYTPAEAKAGVSFRLIAVQVIELVTKGQYNGATFGFSEEQGFDGSTEEEAAPAAETKTEGAGDAKDRAKGDF